MCPASIEEALSNTSRLGQEQAELTQKMDVQSSSHHFDAYRRTEWWAIDNTHCCPAAEVNQGRLATHPLLVHAAGSVGAVAQHLKEEQTPVAPTYQEGCPPRLGSLNGQGTGRSYGQLESVAAVGERDAQLLMATLALLGPEQQSERAQMKAGLRGIQQFTAKAVDPQAVLLLSISNTEWQALLPQQSQGTAARRT